MFSFLSYPFTGLIGLVVPFFLLFLGFRIIRRIFYSAGRNAESPRNRDHFSFPPYGDYIPTTEYPKLKDNGTEARIFRLADKMKGRITLSDIVIEMNFSLKEAEEIIEGMIDGVHVTMEVKDSGRVVYEFPELIAKYEDGS